MRGCFVHPDPIRDANLGHELLLHPKCMQYYLFCDAEAKYWIDTAPVSVGTLGSRNKKLLKRMGSRPRGFSSSRVFVPSFRVCV